MDLAHPANWDKLKDFLDHGFSGGTNGEEMLKIALRVLETETYSLADILIISDFEFSKPIKNTIDKMCEERAWVFVSTDYRSVQHPVNTIKS